MVFFSLTSLELYDQGLGFDPNWQPLLTMVSPFILPGSELTASGSRFQGISEASGGNGVQNSSSNYPLVQLLSLVNEQTLFLPVDAMAVPPFDWHLACLQSRRTRHAGKHVCHDSRGRPSSEKRLRAIR